MNYFTPEFTPDLSANHTRIIRKLTPDLFGNLSANHTRFIQKLICESHKIYSETYLRITQDLFGNLFMLRARGQRGQHVPCIALISHYSTHF